MFTVDQQFQKNMNLIAGAIQASNARTVKAMGLNAKDRTLQALAKYVDKPTPFMMRKGAYQASAPKLQGDDVVVDYTVAPIQAGVLTWLVRGGARHPGDTGTTKDRIWLPTFAPGSKNTYGGLSPAFIKKLSLLISRNKKGKGAGRSVHYGFDKLTVRGKKATGIWKFPGRKSYTTTKPLMRAGKAVIRKGRAAVKKVKHWFDVGEPVLMAESRLETTHPKRIDWTAEMQAAHQYGISQQPRYLAEELAKLLHIMGCGARRDLSRRQDHPRIHPERQMARRRSAARRDEGCSVSIPDLINGAFELLGGGFIALSVARLHREKRVAGVSWIHVGFFTAWGAWNLWFYPHLGQWLSFAGGVLLVVINTIWLGQLIYYSRRP